jgi:hypothetical protein
LINTEGRETFPFVNADNEIYFASDGHPGLGGLDIFVSKIRPTELLERFKMLVWMPTHLKMILDIGLIQNPEEVFLIK